MKKYLVLGAGMMGSIIAKYLSKVGHVTLADFDAKKAEKAKQLGIEWKQIDVTDHDNLVKLMKDHDVAISAVRFDLHYLGAQAAIKAKCNFCDLGTDPDILKKEFALDEKAKEAGITIIPDCGASPGLTNIFAALGASKLDSVEYIRMYVGMIPLKPIPPLNYMTLFSTSVLVNEYTAKAEIIKDGEVCQVDSLTGLEKIVFPGFDKLEAFYAACGTSTLARTFKGKIKELDNKTIRYSGHCEKIKELLERYSRKELEDYLFSVLPDQGKDVILMRVVVGGQRNSEKIEIIYSMVERYDDQINMTATAKTTSLPVFIIAQMLANDKITQKGVLEQELYVPYQEFLDELAKRGIKIEEKISKIQPQ